MKVSIQYAAEHFEDLVSAAQSGEAVEIACVAGPPLRLERAAKRILGAGSAIAHLPSEEELEQIDREWKREIEEKTIGAPSE